MRRRRLSLGVVAFGMLAALLTACGSDDGGSDASAQDPADLEGKDWVLTQMLDADGKEIIVDIGVSAAFDGSTVSGVSGCNNYNASYEATGDQISFGEVAGTKMACAPDIQEIEDRYLELLATIGTFEVDGRSMSMTDTEGTPVLQYSQGG